jgi:5-methyltetrahydropteroyltriglutamate--homocysteine methyltransferase
MLQSTVTGNYPKLPTAKGDVNIRKVLHRFDKSEIGATELDQAYDEVTKRVVHEQTESGIDLPTDGQIRWDDILTPLAAGAEGFTINGLIRWFDNNVYYRKPVIVGKVGWRAPVAAERYRFATTLTTEPVKAVLPAPYSFMKLSENRHYRQDRELLEDLVSLLRAETKALIDAGAKHIQFDDPCLQFHPEHVSMAADALNTVVKELKATFWLCFYFGSVEKIAPKFGEFQVDVVAVDCVSVPTNREHLMRLGKSQTPCFGLIDARNIKLESEGALKREYDRIGSQHPDAFISTSCGLEFLPHRNALEKTRLLGHTVRQFRGE